MRRCQILIPFQGAIITVEELGGITNDFVIFNPDRSGDEPDYKVQTADSMLLRFEGENKLISILDYNDEFIIIDSKGKTITDSLNTNPEFVEHIVNGIIERGGSGIPRKDLN